ncbi:membrane-associated protein, putative [Bodo saltans]|uniref:Membrane-associated protein, putative n=1 Tax=Bodo saltans TaxID=75058 RepID=A0A0S4KGF0_BODSA|nr:membrane-associated protein, putative [Bodo saltans]|eukprot:CUI14771.1 membrane-associated protein, putative [Bodo saltans]
MLSSASSSAGAPHYRNDGSGRDTYVNNASAVMSLTGKVAPSQAARDSIDFWKSPMRPLTHSRVSSFGGSLSSNTTTTSASALRIAVPPGIATSGLVHRNELSSSYQRRLFPPYSPASSTSASPVSPVVATTVGGSRPYSALVYESSSHRTLRLGRTGPVEKFEGKYVHALPTIVRK